MTKGGGFLAKLQALKQLVECEQGLSHTKRHVKLG